MASPSKNIECFGPATISSQGQVTIPKGAREASGLGTAVQVCWVFVEEDKGRILLTHEPEPDDVHNLLNVTADAARRKRQAPKASSKSTTSK